MKLYFIRHGLTPYNKLGLTNGRTIDDPLAEEGVAQAAELAKMAPRTVEHIYSSDLIRSKQTSEIINQELGVSLTLHPELREIDLGSFTGKSWKEINELTGRNFLDECYLAHNYDFKPWGGESVQEVSARVKKFLDEVKKNNKEALIVSHGGIVRTIYYLLKGETLKGGAIGNAKIHEFEIS
ncbi:MAG: histidine phosphatase family protein [Patescibacteria group bacterium]